MSAPGSMIITNFMTAEGLNLLRTSSLRSDLDPPPKNARKAANNANSTATSAHAMPNDNTDSGNGVLAESSTPINAEAGTKHAIQAAGSSPSSTAENSSNGNGRSPSEPALSNRSTVKDNQQGAGSAGSNGNGRAGLDDAAGAASVQKPGGGAIRKTGLLSQFKWGCPDNVEEVGTGVQGVGVAMCMQGCMLAIQKAGLSPEASFLCCCIACEC